MATAVGLAMKNTADTAGIARGMNRTEQLLSGLSKQAASATSSLRTLAGIEIGRVIVGGVQAIGTALTDAARGAVSYAQQVTTAVDATADLAARTGIGVEALQSLQLAAKLSGVEDVTGALQRMGVAIGKAAESGKTDAFTKLGLDFSNLQSLSPEDQFAAIGNAISALPTDAERAAAAMEIFGRTGVELLPLFADNAKALEERFKRLGIVLSEDQVGAIQEMNDALDLVRATFDGIIGQVSANLAPLVTDIANEFLSFVEGFQGLDGSTGGTGIADAITSGLLAGAEFLAGVFDAAVAQFSGFSVSLEAVGSTFTQVGDALTAIAEVFRGLFNIFELIGNGIAAALGAVLEAIGSYISSDLEQFGKDFKENAIKAGEQNSKDIEGAFANAVKAGSDAINGRQAEAAQADAVGPAQARVRALQDQFANRNSPENVAERERRNAERDEKRRKDAEASKAASEARRLQEIEEKKQKKIAELNEKYADKAADIEADRVSGLARTSSEALIGNDLRSSEGMSQFLALATGREDPAIEEYRKQLRELQDIKREIAKANAPAVEI